MRAETLFAICTIIICLVAPSIPTGKSGHSYANETDSLHLSRKERFRNNSSSGKLFGDISKREFFSSKTQNKDLPQINRYLWFGALDALGFMPLAVVDPFGGVIVTGWQITESNPNERIQIRVRISSPVLKISSLKVEVVREKLKYDTDMKLRNVRSEKPSGNNELGSKYFSEARWVAAQLNTKTEQKIENAILLRARQLKVEEISQKKSDNSISN